jgi:predicted phage-related endonuclease
MVDKTQLIEDLKTGIGASEAPILLLGECYGKTIKDLYSLKRGFKDYDIGGPDIERGNILEPIAVRQFVIEYELELFATGANQEVLRKGAMLCHPDGHYIDDEGYKIPVEFKCPRSWKVNEVKNQGVPDVNQIQLQHQMYLMGSPYGYMSYFSADMWSNHIIRVERNQSLIDIIVERCEKFWKGVLEGELVIFEAISETVPIGAGAVEYTDDMEKHLEMWSDNLAESEMVKTDLVRIMSDIERLWPKEFKKITGELGSFVLVQKKNSKKPYIRAYWAKEDNDG